MKLPFSIEAEKAILACMIFSESATGTAVERLEAIDFFDSRHKIIFSTIATLFAASRVKVEISALLETLASNKKLDDVGDSSYIREICDTMIDLDNLDYYVKSVAEKSVLRQLVIYANTVSDKWSDSAEEVEEQIVRIEKDITDITRKRRIADFVSIDKALSDYINTYAAKKGKISETSLTGITSGFDNLDRYTNGFQKGELIILAARPSVGKTALALNFLVNAAITTKKPVVMFSVEMSTQSLTNRILSIASSVDSKKFSQFHLDEYEESTMQAAIKKLRNSNIHIDDSSPIKVIEMKTKLQKLQALHGDIGLVIIDYLQLITPDVKSKSDNKVNEVAAISAGLKSLARTYNVPFLVLSQLSRGVEQREDKVPKLSDLRDSGSIEQDADIVMFIHRDDYYGGQGKKGKFNKAVEQESAPEPTNSNVSAVDLIIAKNRNGSTGKVFLSFNKKCAQFTADYSRNSSKEAD